MKKTTTINTHGGKRSNAGRHKLDDPKIRVSFYIPSSIVLSYSNIDEFRLKYKDLFSIKVK